MFQFLRALFSSTPSNILKETDPMKKFLLVGLGNIGEKYAQTRHNIGFSILEHLADTEGLTFKDERLGAVAEFKYKGRAVLCLKPSTYMNLSGKAVRYWLQKEKIEKSNLLVIMDDLNIPFGKQR